MPDSHSAKRDSFLLFKILGISSQVSRALYAVVGFGLMLFKYGIEALTVYVLTDMFFNPLQFVIPSAFLREPILKAGPDWLGWAMVLWSIPFLWIAATMSVRRAIDAGLSPWVGMLVIVPFINLPSMLMLATLPSRLSDSLETLPKSESAKATHLENKNHKGMIFSAFAGVLVGGLFALAVTVFSVYALDSYGSSLFIAMPLVTGTCAGYVFNQPAMQTLLGSITVGVLSVALGGLGLLLFAFEGVVCLAMAFPILAPLGAFGGALGWLIAKTILLQSRYMLGGALFFVPFLALVEFQLKEYKEFVVESEVIVHASPEEVWSNVVTFPDITEPPAWYFRLGIASPLRARIEGRGVGAVRYCEFTTGSFVEPITVWDEPKRLAFDVAEQPDPLVELSPYQNVRPPHLQHILQSVRGEFQLTDLKNGTTLLTGRTWYTVDMGPRIYWKMWTDEIIHQIHLRVLDHIREESEPQQQR